MKNVKLISGAGLVALLFFSGCGQKEKSEAEVVRELEETFSLNAGSGGGSGQEGFPSSSWPTSSSSSATAPDRSAAQQSVKSTESSESIQSKQTASSATPATVSPALQNVAQDVVGMINSRQFASAVGRLDQLIQSPNLTPAQRRVTRDAMAEVQRMLITDTSISDVERQRAEDAIKRE